VSKGSEGSKLLAVERSVRDSIEQIDRLEATLKAILHDIGKMSGGLQEGVAQQAAGERDASAGTVVREADDVEAELRRLTREFHTLSSIVRYDAEDEVEEGVLHAREFARLIALTQARMAETDRWLLSTSAGGHGA
jgi:hypothetical protein